jgi:hypothetical protein
VLVLVLVLVLGCSFVIIVFRELIIFYDVPLEA